jgi:hypothetical protein
MLSKSVKKTATYGVGSRDNGLAHAVTCGRLLRLMPICNGIHFIELRSFINHKQNVIKISKQQELKTIVAAQQKCNDSATVLLLHRNNFIARRIAVAPGV